MGQSVDLKEGCLRREWVFFPLGLMCPRLDPGVMVMGGAVGRICGDNKEQANIFSKKPSVVVEKDASLCFLTPETKREGGGARNQPY